MPFSVLKNAIDWSIPNGIAGGRLCELWLRDGARGIQQLRQTLIEIQVAPIRSSVHIPVATLWAHYQAAMSMPDWPNSRRLPGR